MNQESKEKYLKKIRGSLIGGAAGDALGYTVEFTPDAGIRARYGEDGITSYELTDGIARFSDDTQMTLFTANGLLHGETCAKTGKAEKEPHMYVADAYRDWLYTQDPSRKPGRFVSWLAGIPELHDRRAPGNTCMSALRSGRTGSLEAPLNPSCGCGGVMRAAPVGLFYDPVYAPADPAEIVRIGALTAAFTHGHPWGYIPSGMLSLIVNRAAFSDDPLENVILYAFEVTKDVFGKNEYWAGYDSMIRDALDRTANGLSDRENIRKIGEGWVGHEALAIACYAALRHERDFSRMLIAAVNHDGDSDSTGSVAGNILGAYLGMDGIGAEWTENLELRDTILGLADDLCAHCQTDENGEITDPAWRRKYADVCDLNGRSE